MQRFVYAMAKDHHTEDVNQGTANPSGMNKASKFNDSAPNF